MRLLPLIAAGAAALLTGSVATSCKEDARIDTATVSAGDVPTMMTRDVETLISDSGVTRYRINTPVWYMYDEVQEPYWKFPEGLKLVKFDNFFRTEATVDADSATYFKNKQVWRLDGNVNISNVMNEKFLTQQLYSDSFIHIERTDRVLEGYGFESNEQMTRYTIKRVSGIFPASEFKSKGPRADADSIGDGESADAEMDPAAGSDANNTH